MFRSSLGRLGLFLVSLLGLMSLFSASAFAVGPPIVSVSAATGKSLNTATLNGTVNLNGGTWANYKFEYGKTKLYGSSTSSTSAGAGGAVSATVLGLEPLNTYHFRISATNAYGTTYSEDMTFETLLAWKVNGKYASELSPAPLLQAVYPYQPVTIENPGGYYKVSCKTNFGKGEVVLNQEYNLYITQCHSFIGGVEQGAICNPPDKTLHLNAFAVTTKNEYLEFNEECGMPEKINLAGGFAIAERAEQKVQTFTFTSTVNSIWKFSFGPVEMELSGPHQGLKYGVL